MKYDFCGWATKNDLRCSDGRIIRHGAFKVNDGQTVPLVWNHRHGDPEMILGNATLKNRKDGVYAYCKLNNGAKARSVREALAHGDITALSILANNLVQEGSEVIHGAIREVSLVLAGANPGAFVESVMAHGMPMGYDEEEGILYTGEQISFEDSEIRTLSHAAVKDPEPEDDPDDETIGDIYETLTDKQKQAVAIMVGMALEDGKDEEDDDDLEEDDDDLEGDDNMRHNIFERDYKENCSRGGVLCHADQLAIIEDAKNLGSLRKAIAYNLENGVLQHAEDLDTTGMTTATGSSSYGLNDPSMLFPDYKNVSNGAPEWISRNMDWVNVVMNSITKTPFSRIKSLFANITEDEARARGYIKGKIKKDEVFTTLKRTTDPQTIYKRQKLDRDDIVDITDFDVISWIRAEMRVMLNEEIARAILIGDGRLSSSDDKIQEIHVRPVVTDVPLFNIKKTVSVANTATPDEIAKEIVKTAIRARKSYKGSGNPTLFTTEDTLTDLLLLEDTIGHRIYKTEAELATALRVSNIVTVEVMEDAKVDEKPLLGVIVNLKDYKVGADKGGEINNFEDFDIDFNQHKYLIETRISGALVKPFSAISLLLDKSGAAISSANLEK